MSSYVDEWRVLGLGTFLICAWYRVLEKQNRWQAKRVVVSKRTPPAYVSTAKRSSAPVQGGWFGIGVDLELEHPSSAQV